MKLISTNPSLAYETIGSVKITAIDEIENIVIQSHNSQIKWHNRGVTGRIDLLRKLSAKFSDNINRLAELQSIEMGMPISQSIADINFGIEYFNSYLDKGTEYLKPTITFENDTESDTVYFEPYGVVACIVPWNYPFSNFVWQCGQNLVAGNSVIFKHSEESPLCGKLIDEIVNSILPDGVFIEIYGDGSIGEKLVKSDINLICFTGSTTTGIKINELAASRLIPTSLELGGSAPGIIFEGTDISKVINTIYNYRFSNCGQACDALKRLIVHESLFDQVVLTLSKILSEKRIGNAINPQTDIGPLVSKRQLDLLIEQVNYAINKGAKIIVGGKQPKNLNGAYYEPTIITNVTNDMRIWNQEVFGPVLPIVSFSTEDQAITLANDTNYGLGAYIFTDDAVKFNRVANQLQSGMISQNNLSYVNVCNPFTGYNMSGGGREHAQFGFGTITRLKLVVNEK